MMSYLQVSEGVEDLVAAVAAAAAAAAAAGVLDYRNPVVHCIRHEDLNLKQRKKTMNISVVKAFESLESTHFEQALVEGYK